MKSHSLKIGAVPALLALLCAGAQAATITVSCGSPGQDFDMCKKFASAWAERNGHTVKMLTLPNSSNETLALFRQLFAAKSSDLDIVHTDVVWPGVLKDHLIDLKPYSKGAEKAHFPAIIANNTVGGKLLAMPSFTDAGLMYYRRDLLEKYGIKPPATWEELAAAARTVQDGERAAGSADFHGYVFQAKAYEGLSCNALEWVASFGGGDIVDATGKITINNPNAARALDTAASWIGTIAPKGVLSYSEEEARGVFQTGKAAFMRNWPYAWSLSQGQDSAVKGKVGVMPIPRGGAGGKPAATLGGWQLAVSKYSKHPEIAADLVLYLTSPEVQKERAITASLNPTIVALYKDPDVLKANPFMGQLYDVFSNAVPRPATATGGKYPEVSQGFWDAAHEVLSGKSTGEDSLKRLEVRLDRVKRNGW